MSSNVTRKSSIANRPTCGGPIKAGLAPRATNFNLSMKTNHRFSGRPFVDRKNSSDYACNGSGGLIPIVPPNPPPNSRKLKLYVTTADRFNTERDSEMTPDQLTKFLEDNPDLSESDIENFNYSYPGQIDSQFVEDLFKENIINRNLFDVTYLLFNRSQDFTKNNIVGDPNFGKKEVWVKEYTIDQKRNAIASNPSNSNGYVPFKDYLERNGTPDVLMGRFGSGSTSRLYKAIENAHNNHNDSDKYPLGLVWSFTSTGAYLSNKDEYKTVVRSQMSDGNLATMFADWLFSNIKERNNQYPDIEKFKVQFATPGPGGDSWARGLATDLIKELNDIAKNYRQDSDLLIEYPDNLEQIYKFDEDGTFPEHLDSKWANTEVNSDQTEKIYTYTVMLPDPVYSADTFWEKLQVFLERNPKYSDDNYSTIITGDSFFYYSPKIIETLDMVNRTRILTMAFGNADIRFENLLMNWYNLETPKLARIGKALEILSDVINTINNSDKSKNYHTILEIISKLYGSNGSRLFNSCFDMSENSLSVGQILYKTPQPFLWDTLRKASWDHVKGEPPKQIELTVSIVEPKVKYLLRNAEISDNGTIAVSEGLVLSKNPVPIRTLLGKSPNFDYEHDQDNWLSIPIQNPEKKYYLTQEEDDAIIISDYNPTSFISYTEEDGWALTSSEDEDMETLVYVREDGDEINLETTNELDNDKRIKLENMLTDKVIPFWENIINQSLINKGEERAKVNISIVKETARDDKTYQPMFLNLQNINSEEPLGSVMEPYNLTRKITEPELKNYAERIMNSDEYSKFHNEIKQYQIKGNNTSTVSWDYPGLRLHWYQVGRPNNLTILSDVYRAGDIRIGALSHKTMANAFAGLPTRAVDLPSGNSKNNETEKTYQGIGSFGADITLNIKETWYKWKPKNIDSLPTDMTYEDLTLDINDDNKLVINNIYYLLANKTDGKDKRLAEFKYRGVDKWSIITVAQDYQPDNNTDYYITSDMDKLDWDDNGNGWDVSFILAHEFGHALGLVDRPFEEASLVSIMNQGRLDNNEVLGEFTLDRNFNDFKTDCGKYGNVDWEIQSFRSMYANSSPIFRPVNKNSVKTTIEGTMGEKTTFSAVQLLRYYWGNKSVQVVEQGWSNWKIWNRKNNSKIGRAFKFWNKAIVFNLSQSKDWILSGKYAYNNVCSIGTYLDLSDYDEGTYNLDIKYKFNTYIWRSWLEIYITTKDPDSQINIEASDNYTTKIGAVAGLWGGTKAGTGNIRINNFKIPSDEKKYLVIRSGMASLYNSKQRQIVLTGFKLESIEIDPPVIRLSGNNPAYVELGSTYNDAGATVTDASGKTVQVTSDSNVDTNKLGKYRVIYTYIDPSENKMTAYRDVQVIDTLAPRITLNGSSTINLSVGTAYNDPGATARDYFGPIEVTSDGQVDTSVPGTYRITYSATDASGNTARATRTVIVGELIVSTFKISNDPTDDISITTNSRLSRSDWLNKQGLTLDNIIEVVFSNNLAAIEAGAFENCTKLSTVTIPNSVTNIGAGAFYNCTSLASITIPDSVTAIGNGAFRNCNSLTSVSIGSGLTKININTFRDCKHLTTFTGGTNVGIIEEGAFRYCNQLTTFTGANNVEIIEQFVFQGCVSLASIIIPNSVTSIGNYAFNSCTSLASIIMSNSVTSIGNNAFQNCTSLTAVSIPDTVTGSGLGRNAFLNCESLISVSIGSGLKKIDSSTFNNCKKLTTVTGANNVEIIERFAFENCEKLSSISLLNISETSVLTNIRRGAFMGCTSLTQVILVGQDSNSNFVSKVRIIDTDAFRRCTELSTVELPVSSSSDHARETYFQNEWRPNPDGLLTLGDGAFKECNSNLTIYWHFADGRANWSNAFDATTWSDPTNPTDWNITGNIHYMWVPSDDFVHYTDGTFNSPFTVDGGGVSDGRSNLPSAST